MGAARPVDRNRALEEANARHEYPGLSAVLHKLGVYSVARGAAFPQRRRRVADLSRSDRLTNSTMSWGRSRTGLGRIAGPRGRCQRTTTAAVRAGSAYGRQMYAVTISLLVTACVFVGGLIGVLLHPRLPQSHLTRETQDVVKLGIGMLSVLASLVLGLLIATAKGSSDTTDRDVRSYAADIIVLAETLRDYGADAATPTDLLRRFTSQTLHDIWPEDGAAPALADPRAGQTLEHVRKSIRALHPVDAGQRWLQDQALTLVTSLLRQRWQLIEHQGPNVRPVVLAILVSWIAGHLRQLRSQRAAQRYGGGGISCLLDGDRRLRLSDHRDGQPIPGRVADPSGTDGERTGADAIGLRAGKCRRCPTRESGIRESPHVLSKLRSGIF